MVVAAAGIAELQGDEFQALSWLAEVTIIGLPLWIIYGLLAIGWISEKRTRVRLKFTAVLMGCALLNWLFLLVRSVV